MSLSLIGIIFVQGYWINNTVVNNEEQFSFNAKQVLITVSNKIQYKEFEEIYYPLKEILDSIEEPDDKTIRQLLNISIDKRTNRTFSYNNGALEDDYKLFSSFINFDIDTIKLKDILNRTADIVSEEGKEERSIKKSKLKMQRIKSLTDLQRMDYEIVVNDIASYIPIHRRVDNEEIHSMIQRELEERDIKVDFEYAIYSNALATKVRSEDFSLDYANTYAVPLFVNQDGESKYQLYVKFTDKKQYVLSSIRSMALLSIVFTLIIVVAYSSALSQLMQQRQNFSNQNRFYK